MDNLIQQLKDEISNFCDTVNEEEQGIRVLTADEIEDDKLDLEEVILDTEPNIDRAEINLVDIINKVINGEANLDDVVDASMKIQAKRKETEGK